MNKPSYSAPVLEDFSEDPRKSEHNYLTESAFADEIVKLAPAWATSSWSMTDVLRAFDEAGLLRPRLRLRLPEYSAWYDWHGKPNPVVEGMTQADRDLCEYVKRNFLWPRRDFSDPVGRHPIFEDEVLAPFLEGGSEVADVDWKAWQVEVGTWGTRAVPVRRPFVRSLYASWQRLRAWALLEACSVSFLVDPRKTTPTDLMRGDNHDLTGKHLFRTSGHGRGVVLLDDLERDGWMTALYRAREIISWSELRYADPKRQYWPEGESLTSDERWAIERTRMAARCRKLAGPWRADSGDAIDHHPGLIPEPFCGKLRKMLELWFWAQARGATAFTEALFADIFVAVDWAMIGFETTFAAVDAAVGVVTHAGGASVSLVLQPTRARARARIDQHLGYLIEAYNKDVRYPPITLEEGTRFFDYLDSHELWIWACELADYLEADRIPGDVNRDRRFLHIRSLALLNEQLLVALVEERGSEGDKRKIGTGKVRDPLKSFLTERPGWRAAVWQRVQENYHLTATSSAATIVPADWASMTGAARLRSRLDAIAATVSPTKETGIATQIVLFATIRNFGAHRFSRDSDLIHSYGGIMIGAVLFSALFYWKIAHTD